MVDLRLLSPLGVGTIALFASACGTAVGPALAGRIIDRATGAPIREAEIFTYLEYRQRPPWLASGRSMGHRWTTTDKEGLFSFDREVFSRRVPLWRVGNPEPRLLLLHGRYGVIDLPLPADRSAWTELELPISPDAGSLTLLEKPSSWSSLCIGLDDRGACLRACEVAYRDLERCEAMIP